MTMRDSRHQVLGGAAIAVLILAILTSALQAQRPVLADDALPRPVSPRGPLLEGENRTMELFQRMSPCVVYITSITTQRDRFSMNLFDRPSGTGSGFIWNKEGFIVTNYHVIHGASAAEVTLYDQTTFRAKVVGAEPDKDLAVLKIEAPSENLFPIVMGTSKNLQVGQMVLAIGNPFGLDQTLTTGVISGLGREIESLTRRPIQGAIQTDAAINPGNSGGPLLDSAGRLIGINTAIYSPSGAYAGVGFAVPVDVVNRLVPQLIKYGRVIKPGLGISIGEDYVARRLGLRGVVVVDIAPDSPAERAGFVPIRRDQRGRLLLGDVIVGINGSRIEDNDSLYRILDEQRIGDQVTVTLENRGERRDLKVTLDALHQE